MLRTVVFALTLNPSPYLGEGLLSGSPSPNIGRRGWGMRVFLFIQNYGFQRGRSLKVRGFFSLKGAIALNLQRDTLKTKPNPISRLYLSRQNRLSASCPVVST
ncbi:hypothetical protein [Nostoc sp. 'Lobaria pulmonaria (5183) cyanobiont']|uniref:hypothetical protein n=1 Tax=Nostoc sp. 'Lobaria pulmonaria (5183) cyanobiont' TaxID=1618022 RepID=UPI001319C182|nr:hypothetical protein [Nostoc sp. 'Lobaria pulmonaria (5183) cyanobiont']